MNAFRRAGWRFRAEKTDRTACFFAKRCTPFFLPEIAGFSFKKRDSLKKNSLFAAV
ncbi:MAG: hypothetical protein AB7D39_09350 [Pseudodesulfovibrio sp.]|uniref:hypothetical protein n=1 Tax=Pseudodesulfovibrio sp. TaxID=2035812 RepID=UPI003D0FF255